MSMTLEEIRAARPQPPHDALKVKRMTHEERMKKQREKIDKRLDAEFCDFLKMSEAERAAKVKGMTLEQRRAFGKRLGRAIHTTKGETIKDLRKAEVKERKHKAQKRDRAIYEHDSQMRVYAEAYVSAERKIARGQSLTAFEALCRFGPRPQLPTEWQPYYERFKKRNAAIQDAGGQD